MGISIHAPTEPTRFDAHGVNKTLDIALAKGLHTIAATSISELTSDHNPQPVYSTTSKATRFEEEVRFSILRKIRSSPDVSVTSPAHSSLSAGVLTPPIETGILSSLAERMDDHQDANCAYAELHANFHRGFNINTLSDALNGCRFSDENALFLGQLEENNAKLREFPYENVAEQRFALQHISDLIDGARYMYTRLRKKKIADLTNTLELQIESWCLSRKPLENPFQVVLNKKKNEEGPPG
ncbi:hypothetical protein TNCT_732931 [Trichonephila clavata]|uniref:Uncharacterized protein n=1 Tax=Trichonephila clavata TaxID=2740835 RepID=A0A8X6IX29_TRICU|nr:hypothetical protein TNCT_732931 [Trichonephila clavata]